RLPALVQLLVESGEHHRGERVVRHQRREVDDRGLAEDPHHLRVGFGADFSVAKKLAAERDDRRLLLRRSRNGLAELHRVEDPWIQALLQGDRLVRRPLELAVELARGHEDRKLPRAAGHLRRIPRAPQKRSESSESHSSCPSSDYSFTAPECLIASANFAISASQNRPNSAAPIKRTVRPAFS